MHRARRLAHWPVAVSATGAVALAGPPLSAAASNGSDVPSRGEGGGQLLREYAEDTWSSFVAMTDDESGLPGDNIGAGLSADSRSEYTSPTNIGAHLWSTVVARDLRMISRHEAHERMATTLASVADLERHEWSGQFYNCYHPETGKKLREFPGTGEPIKPFLSSVDNGWLATGLLLVRNAEPRVREQADAIREEMGFGFYYDEDALGEDAPAGQIRGGFWNEDPENHSAVKDNYRGRGPDVWYTGHHYGALNTETRIASHRGMHIVPSWGGSMFEALTVPLFAPEEEWGKRSWALNHPLYVQAQIEHGMGEVGYGYWGFSPSNDPAGGYREYGVDQLGLDGPGYTSDQGRTDVDQPYDGCREGSPPPEEYADGVVTPHASFLALRYAPAAVMQNLQAIRADFDAYGPGGFHDAVAVRSGDVSERHLALDQGMTMAALGNALAHDAMRRYVARGPVLQELRPLMRMEEFATAARTER